MWQSNLQNDLINIAGYIHVIAMDISDVALIKKAKKNKYYDLIVMNVFNLSFKPNSIPIMIDKGTFDAIFLWF